MLCELTGATHPDDHTIDGMVVAMRRVVPEREAVIGNRRLRQLQDRLARGALGVSPSAFLADLGDAMRELAEILDVNTAFVDEIVHDTGTLDVLGAWDRRRWDARPTLPADASPWRNCRIGCEHSARTRCSSWRTSLRARPPGSTSSPAQFGERERTGSIAVAVLFALGYPIGTLGVRTDEPGRRFTPEELAAMKSIASHDRSGPRAHPGPSAGGTDR